jgi:FKBP-type peptidyl-prolyl cis-trans isomerase
MRPLPIVALVFIGALGLGAAAVKLGGTDFTNIPPVPAEVEKLVQDKKLSLGQALDAAIKKTGGVATSAVMNTDTGTVEVMTYAQGKAHKLSVDGSSFTIKEDVEVPPFTFPGDPVSGKWTETPSGLKYFELKEGTGEMPAATSTVKVHYSGWTLDGKQFDSSVGRGQPATFPLNGVIKGWTEGVGSMKVGGKRKLVIPYALAYGEAGRPPQIPARATLVFDVELLEIVKK